MLCEGLLTVVALGLPLTDYVDYVTLFQIFSFKQKINRTAPIYRAKFSEYASFIRIYFQLVKIRDPRRGKEIFLC